MEFSTNKHVFNESANMAESDDVDLDIGEASNLSELMPVISVDMHRATRPRFRYARDHISMG